MTGSLKWKPAFYGWFAHHHGHNLTVRRYRNGRSFSYVPRVDESAETSPAKPYATLAEAKRAAERLLTVRSFMQKFDCLVAKLSNIEARS